MTKPTNTNANEPAYPFYDTTDATRTGLTKREHAAIVLGVPNSGDPEIDAMIRAANRMKLAAMAMQGLLASEHGHESCVGEIAIESVEHADALLAELGKEKQP